MTSVLCDCVSREKNKPVKQMLRLSTDVVGYILQWCSEGDLIQITKTCKQLRRWKGSERITKQIDAEREAKIKMLMWHTQDHDTWQHSALQEMMRVIHARMPMADRRVHLDGPARWSGKSTALRLLVLAHVTARVCDFPEFIIASATGRASDKMYREFRDSLCHFSGAKILTASSKRIDLDVGGMISVWFRTSGQLADRFWSESAVILIDDLWVTVAGIREPPHPPGKYRAIISTGRPQDPDAFTPPWRLKRFE